MDELSSRLDEYATGLRQLQDQEQARYDDLMRRAMAAKKNIGRIERAIRELTDESAAPKAKSKRRVNAPSAETVDRVYHAIREANGGITYDEIIAKSGLSHDPVRRAVKELRDREIIRKAGVDSETRKTVFRLMPEPAEAPHG